MYAKNGHWGHDLRGSVCVWPVGNSKPQNSFLQATKKADLPKFPLLPCTFRLSVVLREMGRDWDIYFGPKTCVHASLSQPDEESDPTPT